MSELLFLKPVFQERIWGGNRLSTSFGYDISSSQIGECWGISAHPNGSCEILNGPFCGKTLDYVWQNARHLFSDEPFDTFPLLVKILDAKEDLSVQVHPNDNYANIYHGEKFGKTECWYIIDCDENSEIVFGHNALSRQQFLAMIELGAWDKLLRKVSVKPGDFFYVPNGTIHAIGKKILLLETQQSSDLTYRVYDYDRVDSFGNKRDLHLEKALDVISFPHVDPSFRSVENIFGDLTETVFISEKYFSVSRWELSGESCKMFYSSYCLVSVIEGSGKIVTSDTTYEIKKGDHFIILSTVKSFSLSGTLTCITSRSNNNENKL